MNMIYRKKSKRFVMKTAVSSKNARNIFLLTQGDDTVVSIDDFDNGLVSFFNADEPVDILNNIKNDVNDFLNIQNGNKSYEIYKNNITSVTSFDANNSDNSDNTDNFDNFDTRTYCVNTLRYICLIFPGLTVSNKERYGNTGVPEHWLLSNSHEDDLNKKIQSKFDTLKNAFQKKDSLDDNDKRRLREIVEFFAYVLDNLPNKITEKQLFEFCLFKSIEVYKLSTEVYNVSPESDKLKSKLILSLLEYAVKEKKKIVLDYILLEKKIMKEKVNEKMNILTRLEQMDDDEREVDNFKKYNKLGDIWGKGLQKNLRVYDANAYDAVRENGDVEETRVLPDSEDAENNRINIADDDNPEDDGDEQFG